MHVRNTLTEAPGGPPFRIPPNPSTGSASTCPPLAALKRQIPVVGRLSSGRMLHQRSAGPAPARSQVPRRSRAVPFCCADGQLHPLATRHCEPCRRCTR
eukprot:scaffold11980_cov98-Isochrysis_galbana.AAC.6